MADCSIEYGMICIGEELSSDLEQTVFSVGEYYALPGEDVEVTIEMSGAIYRCIYLGFKLRYDKNILSCVDIAKGDVMNAFSEHNGISFAAPVGKNANILASMTNIHGVVASGEVLTITFHVSEEAEEGYTLPIYISAIGLTAEQLLQLRKLPVINLNGYISVGDEEPVETYEPIVSEAPVSEAQVTEAPVTEVPAIEAPATEAPASEAPVTEAPVSEAPASEAPVTPHAPQTGGMAIAYIGVAAAIAGAGIIFFRRKHD